MNKKAFIKWQVKELLPVYIISFALLAVIFWFTILNSNLLPKVFENYGPDGTLNGTYLYYYNALPPLFAIGVPVIILSFILPFGTFSYQTSHIRSDFFYQVPLKEKELRRLRLLLNLVIALIIISVVYWIGVLFIYVRQVSLNDQSDYFKNDPFFYNYVYFLPYYLVLLFSFTCNYFISSYFVSLGTRILDSVFYLIFGQFVLGLTVSSFLVLIACFSINSGSDTLNKLMLAMPSPSFIEPMYVTFLFSTLILKQFEITQLETITRIVCSSCFVSLGSFLGWYMLFGKKDPSGEYAGKGTPVNLYVSLYPHVFAFVVGLFLASFIGTLYSGFGIIAPIFFILWGSIYYFSIVLTNGGFHFNSKNWIGFGGVTITIVLLTILACCVRQ